MTVTTPRSPPLLLLAHSQKSNQYHPRVVFPFNESTSLSPTVYSSNFRIPRAQSQRMAGGRWLTATCGGRSTPLEMTRCVFRDNWAQTSSKPTVRRAFICPRNLALLKMGEFGLHSVHYYSYHSSFSWKTTQNVDNMIT